MVKLKTFLWLKVYKKHKGLDCCVGGMVLMVRMLDSGVSAPGLSLGHGHCVVFLGKMLYSHSASLHPGV